MGTPIVLRVNDVEIPATLNETVAANDFKTRFPFTVSGYRSTFDYCCAITDAGEFDPAERQMGWKNGDISLAGGWFAVLFAGEEQSQSYDDIMVVAHIDKEHLPMVEALPKDVTFVVDFA